MIDLGLMEKVQARTPPASELVAAWRAFFTFKLDHEEPINHYHAGIVLITFNYLQEMAANGQEGLTKDDVNDALKSLRLTPKDNTTMHNKLARLFYAELQRMDPGKAYSHLRGYVNVLAATGDATEARELWKRHCVANPLSQLADGNLKRWNKQQAVWIRGWARILLGMAEESNEKGLIETFEMAQKLGLPYTAGIQKIMVQFFAAIGNTEAVKEWYSKSLDPWGLRRPRPSTLSTLLEFCMNKGELDWCKEVFREVLSGTPSKDTWDVVLKWAAGTMGKGVEDVDRMLDVMVRRNSNDESIRPDISTINGLVDLAISFKDPYLAERYISLGIRRGIQPNAETLILQLEYRADAKDLAGCQAVYEALQSEEVVGNADLPAINKYIRALCGDMVPNYDRITTIVADLDEQKRPLEPDTVSALCMLYLPRNEIPEILDLLQVQSYAYTIDERARIIDAFIAFILDRNNSTARAWDAYTVVRQIFDEMSTELRTKCMNEFFARGRCDMACYAFGHMRQHDIHSRRPQVETYVQCFEGIARCEDLEYLHMVHNMMKMDSSIEPTTKLYNSLMLAYTTCGNADRALDFWDDITNSREGPSYRSLEIVFRACGRKPFGDMQARQIWSKMRRMEIEVTSDVFASYVGALAGQGKYEEARDMIEAMETDLGLKPDVLSLVTFYNAIPGQNRKDMVEEWAKERYLPVWKEVEKLGQTEQPGGWRLFNFKRDIKA